MSALVSVLMCVYNTRLDYLKDAVKSVLNQTYQSFEFIIVDDASNDAEVLDYLNEIKTIDNRITIIRNETNQGLTKSLNIGLKECKGEYIARMDSDDISLEERFSKQIEFLQSHSEVALVGSNVICFGDELRSDYISGNCMSVDQSLYRINSLLQHSGPPHPTFMFRASFLRDNFICYPEKILKAQDYGIMVEILKRGGKIRIITTPLVKYRIHSNQITTNHQNEQKIYQLRVSADYIKSLFPELDDCETMSVSALGCPLDADDIIEELRHNEKLRDNCDFELKTIKSLNNSSQYISGLKKLFYLNKKRHFFDQRLLQEELGFRWWALAIRKGLKEKEHWGFGIYTLACARYSLARKMKKIRR